MKQLCDLKPKVTSLRSTGY